MDLCAIISAHVLVKEVLVVFVRTYTSQLFCFHTINGC